MDRDERSDSLKDPSTAFSDDRHAYDYSKVHEAKQRARSFDHRQPLSDFEAVLKSRLDANLAEPLRTYLDAYLKKHFSSELTERATELLYRRQPEMSARSPMPLPLRASLIGLTLALILGGLLAPSATALVVLSVILAYCAASMALKATLAIASIGSPFGQQAPQSGETPIVTILLPVNKEGIALVSLVTELEKLNYPKHRLDLKFLVEEDDPATRKALESLNLPSQFEILSIPKSHPQTKPKAMNYALPFVRGEIVGIYDAEDQPDADQIRKAVDALTAADERTVCVQCRLNHYDATETYFSRMASIEYTLWFDMLLRGLSRLKLPVPLGGTSLFINGIA